MSALELVTVSFCCLVIAMVFGIRAFEGGMNVPLWLMSLGFGLAGVLFAVRAKNKL